jgi:hypothetical protein
MRICKTLGGVLFGILVGISLVGSCRTTSLNESSTKANEQITPDGKPIFMGIVKKYTCKNYRQFGEICFVGLENTEVDNQSSEKYIGIILDGEFEYDTHISVGSQARADTTYTDEFDNLAAIRDLSQLFGRKYRYFFHPEWSYGGFADVIENARR